MTRVWLWVGLLWSDRVRMVLDKYGDRITDVSIFGWSLDTNGSLFRTFNPANLDPYRAKWPHIRWWGCFRNMEARSGATSRQVFDALRFNSAARNRLAADVQAMFASYPWLHGVDIDMEGGGNLYQAESEAIFRKVAATARSLGKKSSGALPALTATGSVGGENWVRYKELGQILDHVSVMSYDMAWNGSAPGPISPGFWMEDVYSWAASQIPPHKLSMGLPAYGRAWTIHDEPTGAYRGTSGAYYAVRNWLDGTWPDTAGDPDQPLIGWLAYRQKTDKVPWALLGVYDWAPPSARSSSSGMIFDTFTGRGFTTRYPRAAGNPMWTLANNKIGTQHATYVLRPRKVRDVTGAWVGPRHGFNLTAELLRRPADSALILDEDCRTWGQLGMYYTRSGTWQQWTPDEHPDDRVSYGQYRTTGGSLTFNHSFGTQALHVQARAQLPAAGRWGVTVGKVRADINQDGSIRLLYDGTVVGTASTAGAGTGSTAGQGRAVLGLRVRHGRARAYAARTENSVPLVLTAAVPSDALNGSAGVWASGSAWFDHIRLGDGWWYEPHEAVEIVVGGKSKILGRDTRTGVTWDHTHNRFRPVADVEESETRTLPTSLDWDYYHIRNFPAVVGHDSTVKVRPIDTGVWLGRLFLCDSQGARICFYADVEYLAHWADRATHDWGLQGVAIWTLGQEDVRIWERLGGAELPADTIVP